MILNREQVRQIEDYIEEIYGDKIDLWKFVVVKTGNKERVWIINRDISRIPIEKLRINSVGLYFGRWDRKKFRLSIEGSMMIKPRKNFVEIEDWKNFVLGFNIKKKCNCDENEYVIVKYKGDTLGIAKYHNGILENVLPKGRKLKKLSNL